METPDPEKTCFTCSNIRHREGRDPLCHLTQETIPVQRTCCHWMVAPADPEHLITLTDKDVAHLPSWHGQVTTLQEYFPSVRASDHVTIPIGDLACPSVYGIPDYEVQLTGSPVWDLRSILDSWFSHDDEDASHSGESWLATDDSDDTDGT